MKKEQNEHPSLQPCGANEDTAATYRAINKQVLIGVENYIELKIKTSYLTNDLMFILAGLTNCKWPA